MILKTLTHDRGNSDCWNWYDNIQSASAYYDENAKISVVAIRFKDVEGEVTMSINDTAYLCNDKGETIEKLRPAKFEDMSKYKKIK